VLRRSSKRARIFRVTYLNGNQSRRFTFIIREVDEERIKFEFPSNESLVFSKLQNVHFCPNLLCVRVYTVKTVVKSRDGGKRYRKRKR